MKYETLSKDMLVWTVRAFSRYVLLPTVKEHMRLGSIWLRHVVALRRRGRGLESFFNFVWLSPRPQDAQDLLLKMATCGAFASKGKDYHCPMGADVAFLQKVGYMKAGMISRR